MQGARMRGTEAFGSEALLSALYRYSADAIIVADAERRIVGCNAAFAALFGYRRDEIRSLSTRSLQAVSPREPSTPTPRISIARGRRAAR